MEMHKICKKPSFPFTIGCDPEFALTDTNGHLLNVKKSLKTLMKLHTPAKLGWRLGKAGLMGWDALHTFEVRPEPSDYPENIVRNMRYMLGRVSPLSIDILSKHEGMQLGGHVHLSFSLQGAVSNEIVEKVHRAMLRAHDSVRGAETHNTGYRDRYRKHFRMHRKNGVWIYEFLLPSAEWFTTERLALSTLSFYAVVFHEAMGGDSSYREHYAKEIAYVHKSYNVLMKKKRINYSLRKGWHL